MREGIKKIIDDVEYEIWHLPPRKAMAILTKLTKLFGEPIGKALGGVKNLDSSIDFDILGSAIGVLTNKLDEVEVQEIIDSLFKYVKIRNEKGALMDVNIDLHFHGKIMHLLNVAGESLEVNFSDFFAVLKTKIGLVFSKAETKSEK